MNATAHLINRGRQLHLQHGPIDLIIEATGEPQAVKQAYRRAVQRFDTVLTELVEELPALRSKTNTRRCTFTGEIAKRMWAAAATVGYQTTTTPMIAVAGSVADEILQAVLKDSKLLRASVNNGGDIALYLAERQTTTIGVVTDLHTVVDAQTLPATLTVAHDDHIGGLATSGWRGRSFSTGIADAVTVLARDAATADTAATLIANAVDLPACSLVKKEPANVIDPDSDLADTLVTVDVLALSEVQVNEALASGMELAMRMVNEQLIDSAGLSLAGAYQSTYKQNTISHQQMPHQQRNCHYA